MIDATVVNVKTDNGAIILDHVDGRLLEEQTTGEFPL